MNRAMRKRVEELKKSGWTPKESYRLMREEQIDDKQFNHAVWTGNGHLEKKDGSQASGN